MPDESLDILIRTKAELAGANQAAGALNQVTDAVKKDGAAMEETAKKAGFLNLKKTEMKKLVRELAHEFPLAGMAARAMMNPIVASLTVAIGIFSKAKTSLDAWNKSMDESAAKAAERDFLPGIEAKAASLREAGAAAITFYRSVDDATKKEDAFTTSLKRAKDALHEYVTAQTEVDDAEQANKLAQVDLAEKLGDMSPGQAISARGKIKSDYRHKAEQLKTQAEDIELKNQESELAHAQGQRESLKQAEKAAREKRDSQKASIDKAKTDEPALKKRYEDAQKIVDEALNKQGELQNEIAISMRLPDPMSKMGLADQQRRLREVDADVGLAVGERDANLRAWNKSKKLGAGNTAEADADLGVAADRFKTNESTLNRLPGDLAAQRANVAMRQDARRVTSGLKDFTEKMGMAGQFEDETKKQEEKQASLEKQGAALIKAQGSLGDTFTGILSKQEEKMKKLEKDLRSQFGGQR